MVAILIVIIYNSLVSLRVQCDNAWADIDVQLKRRYDLIPNLVETVKGYAAHEKGTLEAVISARNRAMSAQGPASQGQAEGMLSGALRQLFALAESYPQLRAVESFTSLQNSLQQIEEALQNARRYYNAVVRDFNTRIHQVPSNFVVKPVRIQRPRIFRDYRSRGARSAQGQFWRSGFLSRHPSCHLASEERFPGFWDPVDPTGVPTPDRAPLGMTAWMALAHLSFGSAKLLSPSCFCSLWRWRRCGVWPRAAYIGLSFGNYRSAGFFSGRHRDHRRPIHRLLEWHLSHHPPWNIPAPADSTTPCS